MKAIGFDRYGDPADVLHLDAIRPRPSTLSASEAAAIPLAATTALWACATSPGSRQDPTRRAGPVDVVLDNVGNLLLPQRFTMLPTRWRNEDLEAVTAMVESGQLTPVLDRTCAMADAPAAMHHLGTGRSRGKIVITVQED